MEIGGWGGGEISQTLKWHQISRILKMYKPCKICYGFYHNDTHSTGFEWTPQAGWLRRTKQLVNINGFAVLNVSYCNILYLYSFKNIPPFTSHSLLLKIVIKISGGRKWGQKSLNADLWPVQPFLSNTSFLCHFITSFRSRQCLFWHFTQIQIV